MFLVKRNSPPLYRAKNAQKEEVFAYDYAKTPQKRSRFIGNYE